MNSLVCSANSFTVYCTLLFSLFNYSGKVTGSLTHRLTSALKKKVDREWECVVTAAMHSGNLGHWSYSGD